uniref:CUB domain-containing protein n=1 Tax=Macrostomum lignano TaxID=282301 RepID=A0A1I8F8M0_9PLAT
QAHLQPRQRKQFGRSTAALTYDSSCYLTPDSAPMLNAMSLQTDLCFGFYYQADKATYETIQLLPYPGVSESSTASGAVCSRAIDGNLNQQFGAATLHPDCLLKWAIRT